MTQAGHADDAIEERPRVYYVQGPTMAERLRRKHYEQWDALSRRPGRLQALFASPWGFLLRIFTPTVYAQLSLAVEVTDALFSRVEVPSVSSYDHHPESREALGAERVANARLLTEAREQRNAAADQGNTWEHVGTACT